MFWLILIGIIIVFGILFYLWAIMPRVLGRPNRTAFWHRYYAHRGLHDNAGDAPENSLKAFQRAVEANYGIELDVQLSKDYVPVVFHDFTLERMCGVSGKVCDYTYEELQDFSLLNTSEKIPRFEQVLNLINGKVPLVVEIKSDTTDFSMCPVIDKVLQSYAGIYCIESFNPLCLWWYRRNHNHIMRGQLSDCFWSEGEYKTVLHWLLQNLLCNFVGRPDFIAYNCKYPNMLSNRIAKNMFGAAMAAWTVKSNEQLDHIREQYDMFIFDSFIPKK